MEPLEADPELEEIRRRKLAALMQEREQRQASAGPVHLTEETFDQFVESHDLVLVDFWAEWCMPCHMIAPTLATLAREYAGRLAVAKVDVDTNRRLQGRFRAGSIPTIVLLKRGEEVARVVGAVPKRRLLEMIEPFLGSPGEDPGGPA